MSPRIEPSGGSARNPTIRMKRSRSALEILAPHKEVKRLWPRVFEASSYLVLLTVKILRRDTKISQR